MKFIFFTTFLMACAASTHLASVDVQKDQTNAALALSIYNEVVADGGTPNRAILKIKAHAIFCAEQGELTRAHAPTVDGGPQCK